MFLILFAIIEEKNLYVELSNVKGLQFCNKFRSFPVLGMQVMVPSITVSLKDPFFCDS